MTNKLVVFDMDGTLIDSAMDIGLGVVYAATSVCNLPQGVVTLEKTRPLIGKDLSTMFELLLPAEHQGRVGECVAAYRAYYPDHCADNTIVYPGLLDLLTELRAADVRLAIATTKLQSVASHVANRLGLVPYFDLIQGVDGFPSKPDPTILRVVMKKLDCQPSDTLMVGDTDNDVLCAQAAGVPVCAVAWGGWPADDLATLSPDFLAHNVSELRDVIYRNN